MKPILFLTSLLVALSGPFTKSNATELSEELIREFNVGFDKPLRPNTDLVAKAREIVKTVPLNVEPKEKRKVLIYGISWGPHRNGMLTAVETLKMIGDETGAYESVISIDLANFEPEALKQFDAVIFPNSTGDVFVRPVAKGVFQQLPKEEQKKELANAQRLGENLVEYVENGGGFLGTHGATDCNKKIPEYIEMVGGAFYGHPWGPKNTVTITVEEPEHGLIKGVFDDPEFEFHDEIYEFNKFSKDKVRVLMSLNIEKSDQPVKTMKTDYVPIAWLKKYGEGRVFFSSFGHAEKTWSHEQFIKFLIPALQYAVGDYEVDDSVE
ncbi:MAG: ThuA domain-containing protein [Verrucomicrobiota bacterium]